LWDELLANAKRFPMDWPTKANRIETIAGDNAAIKRMIVEDALNIHVIVHAKVALFDEFYELDVV